MRAILNIFGTRWELPRHDASEEPASLADSMGYAEFEGSKTLHRCEFRNGRWVDYWREPFDRPVVAWHSVAGMKVVDEQA